MIRIVWIVSYKLPGSTQKEEIKKYTAESAQALANSIEEVGGLAIITEDSEQIPDEINDDLISVPSEAPGKLVW